eukprot:scaffold236701_cov20-Tisochrysis_lutea.AAC.1
MSGQGGEQWQQQQQQPSSSLRRVPARRPPARGVGWNEGVSRERNQTGLLQHARATLAGMGKLTQE